MHPVTSSHIEAIGHEGETMEITFKGNRRYRYDGVSLETFQGLKAADSTGIALRQLGITGTLIVEEEGNEI
jgi:hypothetical protein